MLLIFDRWVLSKAQIKTLGYVVKPEFKDSAFPGVLVCRVNAQHV